MARENLEQYNSYIRYTRAWHTVEFPPPRPLFLTNSQRPALRTGLADCTDLPEYPFTLKFDPHMHIHANNNICGRRNIGTTLKGGGGDKPLFIWGSGWNES
jgi:hypothetical protein